MCRAGTKMGKMKSCLGFRSRDVLAWMGKLAYDSPDMRKVDVRPSQLLPQRERCRLSQDKV